jgi:3-hydroxyisobutyrate dehydrogenase-like beta-hydroxyacid dehydrogenase
MKLMTLTTIKNIGVIGLGRIGTAIASNIVKSDFNLVVYNRTAEKARSLEDAGAMKVNTPREAAMKSDVVITSLLDDRVVLDVVTGKEGILSGLAPNRIHVGTSTVSPSLSTQLAEMHATHNCSYLAAPVLGNPMAVSKFTTFVAGDPASINLCHKLFNTYSQKIINVGKEHAKSNILKLAANYIVSVLVELIGQTYSLAEKSKIDLQLMNELIHMILAYPGLEQYANRIRTRDFDNVGFALTTAFKDVQLILQTSSDVSAPLPFANIIRDKFIAAIANGLDTKDWITTYKITRMLAGLKT